MSNSVLFQVTTMGSSFPPRSTQNDLSVKASGHTEEKNIGKNEGVDRKKSGQAGRQAGRLTGL